MQNCKLSLSLSLSLSLCVLIDITVFLHVFWQPFVFPNPIGFDCLRIVMEILICIVIPELWLFHYYTHRCGFGFVLLFLFIYPLRTTTAGGKCQKDFFPIECFIRKQPSFISLQHSTVKIGLSEQHCPKYCGSVLCNKLRTWRPGLSVYSLSCCTYSILLDRSSSQKMGPNS